MKPSTQANKSWIIISIILISLAVFLLLIAGCSKDAAGTSSTGKKVASDEKPFYECSSDSECICDGVDEERKTCYIGNKEYYDTHVNKKLVCPAKDFCTGPDGNLVIRCVANKCLQFPQCSFDAECRQGRCVNSRCVTS